MTPNDERRLTQLWWFERARERDVIGLGRDARVAIGQGGGGGLEDERMGSWGCEVGSGVWKELVFAVHIRCILILSGYWRVIFYSY